MKDAPRPITVSESADFIRRADKIWSNDEREEFVDHISVNPLAGDLIEGTGGVRKIRWGAPGRGKRGGVRVIYYFHDETLPLYLITMFAKNVKVDLGANDKKYLHEFVQAVKAMKKGGRA